MRREPSRSIKPKLLLAILFVGLHTTGCQTTVGNYFANRGRDFGDCFHLQVGFRPGLGVVAKAGGLAHVGLAVASSTRSTSVGWVYGQGHAFGYPRHLTTEGDWEASDRNPTMDSARTLTKRPWQLEGGFIYLLFHGWGYFEEPRPRGKEGLRPQYQHRPALLPVILSKVDHKWLWRDGAFRSYPYAHIHAFDVEAEVYAGLVYAKAGFSPGEFVDFILGWFGVDIAGDDRPAEAVQSRDGWPETGQQEDEWGR